MLENLFFTEEINKNNIDKTIKAILPYEQTCVNLASILKTQKYFFLTDKPFLAFLNSLVLYYEKKIIGVIIISLKGVVLHCFTKEITQDIVKILKHSFFDIIIPSSIMGERENSLAIERLISKIYKRKTIYDQDYKLLILNRKKNNSYNKYLYNIACNNLNMDLKILQPPMEDVEKIIPLEIDYQNTEVQINNEKAMPNFCKKILEKSIKKQTLYAIKSNTSYYGKATINAIGFFWEQIGGVYTVPELRNKGLASAVISHIISDDNRKINNFALFVKVKNYPAQKMYKKLGFKEFCNFRISYF